IRDKDHLLGLLAEAIVAEVPEPAADLPWRARLEAFATDYRRVLQSHRHAARIVVIAQPAAPRLYERPVRPPRPARFGGEVAGAGWGGEGGVDGCRLLAGTYVPAAVAEESAVGALQDAEQEKLEAPLGTLARGRLELNGGVAGMKLRCDPALAELYAGHFKGK